MDDRSRLSWASGEAFTTSKGTALAVPSGTERFPFVALLVSGYTSCGVDDVGRYAARETSTTPPATFGKSAKLPAGYPGGPAWPPRRVGDPLATQLPRRYARGNLDFSFAGLRRGSHPSEVGSMSARRTGRTRRSKHAAMSRSGPKSIAEFRRPASTAWSSLGVGDARVARRSRCRGGQSGSGPPGAVACTANGAMIALAAAIAFARASDAASDYGFNVLTRWS